MNLLTLSPPTDRPLQLLCVGAHADDIEIGCGGTVLRLLREYPTAEVLWAVFSGDLVRRREAKASARDFLKATGRSTLRCLEFRESYFPDQWAGIKECFESLSSELYPDIVFTHGREDRHQDHRVLWELAWNTFRQHLILEYEIPKYDGDLGQPNLFVTLDEQVAWQKARAIMAHFQSQKKKHWFDEETLMGLMRLRGVECASRYAEAFYCRKCVLRAG